MLDPSTSFGTASSYTGTATLLPPENPSPGDGGVGPAKRRMLPQEKSQADNSSPHQGGAVSANRDMEPAIDVRDGNSSASDGGAGLPGMRCNPFDDCQTGNLSARESGALPASFRSQSMMHMQVEPNTPLPDARWSTEPKVKVHQGGAIISEIVALNRRRNQWQKAIQKLELQEQAICRSYCGGDKEQATKLRAAALKGDPWAVDPVLVIAIGPLAAARKSIIAHVEPLEKELRKLARKLDLYPFAKAVRGFGDLRLAIIVGELGDVTAYRNPACVWKRMGLAVIGDGRQRRITGDAALEHGYSPSRRSVMWNLGSEMLRAQGGKQERGPEVLFYEAEKQRQLEKGITLAHAHNRALRHMTKRILRDLWVFARRVP